ncbi:hypothetical protein EV121DRAFT_274705 [Schizophyllum commune]
MCAEALTDLDTLTARSHHLDQLARRTLGVVAGLATLRNAKSTSIVPRSAPVPLGDRCDTSPWWAGGEELRHTSRVCFRTRNSCELMPNAPRSAPQVFMDCRACRGGGAARRRGCRHRASHFLRLFKGQKMRNRCQMRQGPRRRPSLSAATTEVGGSREGRSVGEARRGAPLHILVADIHVDKKIPQIDVQCAELNAASRAPRCVEEYGSLCEARREAPLRCYVQAFWRSYSKNLDQRTLNVLRLAPQVLAERRDGMGGRLLQDQPGSEATYRCPASEDSTEITSLLVAFRRPASSIPPPLGDEYMYLRPPNKGHFLRSRHAPSTPRRFSSPPRPSPPPPLLSTDFNIPQPLGAEIT